MIFYAPKAKDSKFVLKDSNTIFANCNTFGYAFFKGIRKSL